MLFELLYYFPLVNIINLGIFLLLEYVSDQDMFTENLKNYGIQVSLWAIEKYHTCKDLYMKYVYPYVKPYLQGELPIFTYYNINTQEYNNGAVVPIEVIEHIDQYKVYYNHVVQEDEETVTERCIELCVNTDVIEKLESPDRYKQVSPFIQIEIHVENGDVFDMGSVIKKYLISGNILDEDFFAYIMLLDKQYTLKGKEYTIKCMDQSINMITIEKNATITVTDDGYTLEDNN